jgi:hypothetical protein
MKGRWKEEEGEIMNHRATEKKFEFSVALLLCGSIISVVQLSPRFNYISPP